MSETKNDEHGPDKREPLPIVVYGAYLSAGPIDYSRPVGWWCPRCERTALALPWVVDCCTEEVPAIHVFLPLPTPEPVEVDEVETGDAEVVTFTSASTNTFRICGIDVEFDDDGSAYGHWFFDTELAIDPVGVVNFCAAASYLYANARKKRGMK